MNIQIIQTFNFYFFIWILKPIANLGLSFTYYTAYIIIYSIDYILSKFISEHNNNNDTIINFKKYIDSHKPYSGVY